LLVCTTAIAAGSVWQSVATGTNIPLVYRPPTTTAIANAVPVVFYLKGLASPRVGTEPDDLIVGDLRGRGFFVVEVDYEGNVRARTPYIHQDVAKLRWDLAAKRLLSDSRVEFARVFVVPSGLR
jgi:hypothetical protein